MAEEKDKIDIEDIKDPEDLDLDEVVSENEDSPAEATDEVEGSEKTKEDDPKEKADKTDKTEKSELVEEDDKDVLEKVVEEEKEETTTEKPKKVKKKKAWVKYVVIGVLVALVTTAAVLGVMYYLDQRNKPAETTETDTTPVEEEQVVPEETTPTEEFLYINSEVGLNLRQTPDSKAKVLAIIPFGYKITVLETQGDWVKTTYDGKTGWVSVEYTQTTDPLLYENSTYGFGFTFKSDWAGYKFIEANNPGSTTVKTYYVALPTTDKSWSEPGVPAGYASLFVMGVYTKAEWASMAGGEMLPAKLGEGTKYVYTYLPGQAYATDLKTQYYDIKDIIETFEVLK